MLIVSPLIARKRRKELLSETTAPPVTLVSVGYEEGSRVTLVFNQPVDFSSFDVQQLYVNDASNELLYYGLGEAVVLSPTSCEVVLNVYNSGEPGTTWMTVEPTNGLVSAETGAAWAGCTVLPIPFSSM